MRPGDRRRPTHPLGDLQDLVECDPDCLVIMRDALKAADRMDLTEDDIVEVVLGLEAKHFVKSMPSKNLPGTWQDVYKCRHLGWDLYVKLTADDEGPVVLSFKQDGGQ